MDQPVTSLTPVLQDISISMSLDASTSRRRSTRPRKSAPAKMETSGKRKRVEDNNEKQIFHEREKRRRADNRKMATVQQNERKDARDLSTKRWAKKHSHLFLPLLPSGSFFDALSASQFDAPVVDFHELVEQPALVKGGEMKDYQLHGLSFLVHMYRNGVNCILGDEMGLGKTLQTLSLFAYIHEHSPTGIDAPHLVLCPLSVISSWEAEAARWTPSFRVVRFHGPAPQRALLKQSIFSPSLPPPDIVLTTYESFTVEDAWFKSHRWTYCVLDEGHRIKNADTQLANRVSGLGSLHRLLLTGTPVQNDLTEVWGLFRWLYPTIFTERTEANFKDAFDVGAGKYDLSFVEGVRRLLGVVMLRRTKAIVSVDVPPKQETTLFLPMCDAQRLWTYRILTEMDELALNSVFGNNAVEENKREVLKEVQTTNDVARMTGAGEKQLWQKLNFLLLQLMRLCDHPYLIPGAEPEPYVPGEILVNSSSKLMAIDKILSDVLPKGEQVLIFSQWTTMLDVLSDFLHLRKIPFARLDGSTLRPRRTLDIKLFQRENSPYKVFLISTQAGGLGINLTKASTVILTDSSWNPQNDLQAMARAHRIGQKKVVQVYRLICRASVEDQMLDRLRRKLFLSLKVMSSAESSSSTGDTSQLGLNDICDILRRGSSALSAGPDEFDLDLGTFKKAAIAEILHISRERERSRVAKIAKDAGETKTEEEADGLIESAEEEERRLLSGVAQVKCRLFEGKMIGKTGIEMPMSEESLSGAMTGGSVGKRGKGRPKSDERALTLEGKRKRVLTMAGLTPGQVQERAEAQYHLEKEKKTANKKARQWENEDFCIYTCGMDGEVVMCDYCPRVLHAKCASLSARDLKKPNLVCQQHRCVQCEKSTVEAGGMLFRCQTCPRAYCEECLPGTDDELQIIGENLPEYELLNYPPTSSAYYIRCLQCVELEKAEPLWWEETWGRYLREAERKANAA